jgi:Cdc6-like AAA superfamily ATPase
MRVALRLLKNAIQIASQEKSALSKKHVDDAFKGRQKPNGWRLAQMGEHEQLIYRLIETNGGIQSGDLRKAYEELCQQKNIKAIAERTFLKSLHGLKNAGLISWTWIAGQGRVRAFCAHSGQATDEGNSGVAPENILR